ncbi:uncharacterized protein LOC126896632 [Daktulosphaira vitifoliae]|uniref:uncharacterized protein LOC126896632 n=1 Tax=Daktulosphaira vitifoliae TaxID=58002 RepID=UPI0021AA54F3|nr:uncharacterized protein LOC126896632 [Daktulosphaira vitifoliae]
MYCGIFMITFIFFGLSFSMNTRKEKIEYAKYLIRVMNHIRIQEGWNNIKHLELKMDSLHDKPLQEIFAQNVDSENLLELSIIIIDLLNNIYIEVIRSFLEFLSLIINVCKIYYADNLFKELIDCIELLENGVKKSTFLFEKLYTAITFISNLNIKYAFFKIEGNPFVVVDEIYFVKQFTSNIKLTDWTFYRNPCVDFDKNVALTVISNINKFAKELVEMIFNIKGNHNILENFPYQINIKFMFDKLYNYNIDKYSDYHNFILHQLDTVYGHIAKNEFDNFGFNELLYPQIFKSPLLTPPPDDSKSPGYKVKAMDILINEINWESLSGISILEYHQTIKSSRVFRDPVNVYNFQLKKTYILILLRCRFFEILSEYLSYLTAIVQLCNEEKGDLKSTKSQIKYIESVQQIFDTFKSSLDFFNYIDTAMMNLMKWSIWNHYSVDVFLSPIKLLVNNFIKQINEKKLLRDVFANTENLDLIIIAKQHLDDLKNVCIIFNKNIVSAKKRQKDLCHFNSDFRTYKNNIKIISKKNAAVFNCTKGNDPITNSQQACKEFHIYNQNFINYEYKNLGFHKIY